MPRIILIAIAAFCLIASTVLFILAKIYTKKNFESKVEDIAPRITKITNIAYFLFMAGLVLSLISKFI